MRTGLIRAARLGGPFAFIVMGGAALVSRADAQAPAVEAAAMPAPLPAIVYPNRDPDTAPPPPGMPPVSVPEPVYPEDSGAPITYLRVGGVWGFFDRFRHFHPGMPPSLQSRGPEPRRAGPPGVVPVAHGPAFLPKPVPRAIVTPSLSPREPRRVP